MKHVLGLVRGIISPKRALGMNAHEAEHLSLLVTKGFATTLDVNAPVRRRIADSRSVSTSNLPMSFVIVMCGCTCADVPFKRMDDSAVHLIHTDGCITNPCQGE